MIDPAIAAAYDVPPDMLHTIDPEMIDYVTPHQEAIMTKNIAVTLFSGLGGSSEACRSLGFEVFPFDFMPEAVATLKANGFEHATQADVRDINWEAWKFGRVVEILEGGPPCQPFSQAHDGLGRYDERDMIPEFIRAVAQLTPKVFVMEEVQTLAWKKHADYLARVISDLETIGYRVEARVLNAAHYGIPQARKRLFLVGVREDIAQGWERLYAEWPSIFGNHPVINWPDIEDYEPVTMAQALGWDRTVCYERNLAVPDPRAHVLYEGPGSLAAWPMQRASTTVVGSFRPEVQAAPGYRKAGDGPRQAAPGSVVTTLEERLVLQGMPRDWVVCGSQSKRDLQVGNSVPMPLMRDLIDINIP